MKKIVKMSLVAAVAVAGLTTANADVDLKQTTTTIAYQQEKVPKAKLFAMQDTEAPPGTIVLTYKSEDTGIAAVAAFGGQKVTHGFWGKQNDDYQSIALIGCDVAGGTAHSLVASSYLLAA